MRRFYTGFLNQLPFIPYRYQGERTACNLCGTTDGITVGMSDRRLKPHHSIACSTCGLVRTKRMPTHKELADYYASDYRLDYQFAFRSMPSSRHIQRSRHAAEQRWRLLEPALQPQSRVLDFGAGSGEFLAAAKACGHHVMGFEPTASFAAFARDAYQVVIDERSWQDATYPDNHFHLITANHVLEHLSQPVDAIMQMSRWLADDGIIYISVPDVLAHREHSFQHFHFAHIHYFTPNALKWAGLRAGLEPDQRFSNESTTIVFKKRQGGSLVPAWPAREAERVAAHFAPSSPLAYLVSGTWMKEAYRRWNKAVGTSLPAADSWLSSGLGMVAAL
jgi:SAM-dependent methyltransferase